MGVLKKIGIISVIGSMLGSAAIATAAMKTGGYWENWSQGINGKGDDSKSAYYAPDVQNFSNVYYAFLTLVQTTDPYNPPVQKWNGKYIYESMTGHNVISVMTITDPTWQNPDDWQRAKVQALADACHSNGGKFIWALGGWSDLTLTISADQIPLLVNQCIALLKLKDSSGKYIADGIDFDWEHLSESQDPDDVTHQRKNLGDLLVQLKVSLLNTPGLENMEIGYTTRFNAFWNPPPTGISGFASDGEGLDIFKEIQSYDNPASVLSWMNIMMYDVPPSSFHSSSNLWTMADYETVYNYFCNNSFNYPKNQIFMGFEPGPQSAGGIWCKYKLSQDVITDLNNLGIGGVMFWAINEQSTEEGIKNGTNSQNLANYAKEL